jgi:hypothetical protein
VEGDRNNVGEHILQCRDVPCRCLLVLENKRHDFGFTRLLQCKANAVRHLRHLISTRPRGEPPPC